MKFLLSSIIENVILVTALINIVLILLLFFTCRFIPRVKMTKSMVEKKWFKLLYNQVQALARPLMVLLCGLITWSSVFLKDLFRYGNPLQTSTTYTKNRGMSPWYDLVD